MRFKTYIEEKLVSPKIYCDMDGVLTDFDKEIFKQFGPDWGAIYQKSKKKAYDILIDYGARRFWRDMEWTYDGKKLWNFIKNKNVHILTAVIRDGNEGKKGKEEWIAKNLGFQYIPYTHIVFREQKKDYARPNHILIDDKPLNIREWEATGGIGILHKSTARTIKKLKEIL